APRPAVRRPRRHAPGVPPGPAPGRTARRHARAGARRRSAGPSSPTSHTPDRTSSM
ncbi:MAG: hypothetical protein AVDCRST_MAG07-3415, partial [uncultured Frankineae bacterium]